MINYKQEALTDNKLKQGANAAINTTIYESVKLTLTR
jgi:hypothetical protein